LIRSSRGRYLLIIYYTSSVERLIRAAERFHVVARPYEIKVEGDPAQSGG
jgi:hypothetical protein